MVWARIFRGVEVTFFNPWAEITRTRNRLPHWQQPGATYFLTFRLADSIPWEKLGPWMDEREAWLRVPASRPQASFGAAVADLRLPAR